MNYFTKLGQGIYAIFSICLGGIVYIYITKGLDGDPFIGVLSFAITIILAYVIYVCSIGLYAEFKKVRYHKIHTSTQNKHSSNNSYKNSIQLLKSAIKQPAATQIEPNKQDEQEKAKILKEENEARNNMIIALQQYTTYIFREHLSEDNISLLINFLYEYAEGKTPTPINLTKADFSGLNPKDLYHYGWNVWIRLKPVSRRTTCRILKKAFPIILCDSNENTIYAKMSEDCYLGHIRNIPLEDKLPGCSE